MDNRRPLKTRSKRWVQALAAVLAKKKVSPNAISTTGIVFAMIGGACLLAFPNTTFSTKSAVLLIAATCVQLRLLCNMLDGLVAIEGGLKTRDGDLFNEMPDRVEDIILLVCAGHAAGFSTDTLFTPGTENTAAVITGIIHSLSGLGWACATLAVLTAYIRAFGSALGQKQDFCGPCAKPQRMFLLTAGCLATLVFAQGLNVALKLIFIGTFVTCVRRTWRLWKSLA